MVDNLNKVHPPPTTTPSSIAACKSVNAPINLEGAARSAGPLKKINTQGVQRRIKKNEISSIPGVLENYISRES